MSLLTENSISDAEAAVETGAEMPATVKRGCGDGAYDKSGCYKKFQELGIDWITPLQRGAVLHNLELTLRTGSNISTEPKPRGCISFRTPIFSPILGS